MATETMLGLRLERPEGPASAQLATLALPEPAAGEVRVTLRAAALNHRELWITKGRYPHISLPAILGADGAGVIDAVGEGVDPGLVGAAVMLYPALEWGDDPAIPATSFALLGMPGPGTIAERICVQADRIVRKPAFLSFEEAAAWPLAGLTAWRALFTKAKYKSGEAVLITGAGGGVATCAVAIAAAAGARVFVTSSSAETIAESCARGAVGGVNYREEGWGARLREMAGGIDIVIDGAPSQSYPAYAQALGRGARIVLYGASGGPSFEIKVAELFLNNWTVLGTNMGNQAEFAEMVAFLEAHSLKPLIERVFPLAQAREALLHLEQAHSRGKVVIEISKG